MRERKKMTCGDRSCNDSSNDGRRAGLFFGGALVLAGAAFLLDHMGMLGGLKAWQLWPCLLGLMGLCQLSRRNFIGALITLSIGAAVQLHYLGVITLAWGVIWPALLILLGLVIFIATMRHARKRTTKRTSSDDFFEANIVLGGHKDEVTSRHFKGGDVSCVMGGLELDLRGAVIEGPEAVMSVRITMGGLELKIPTDWVVVVKGNPVMGGFENKTRRDPTADPETSPRLVIEGSVVLGGVEIKN